mgnify:CR=1 FL=1
MEENPWDRIDSGLPEIKKEEDLQEMAKPKSKFPIFIFLTTVILAVVGAGAYVFLKRPEPPRVSVEGSVFSPVPAGVPFTLTTSVSNSSDQKISGVSVTITLPDNFYFPGQEKEKRFYSQDIGDIPPGQIIQREFLVLTSLPAQSIGNVKITAKYESSVGSGGSKFSKENNLEIRVGEPAVGIFIEGSREAYEGQEFDISASFKNNTGKDMSDVVIKTTLPPLFYLSSSVPSSTGSVGVWNVEEIKAGGEYKIKLRGKLSAPQSSVHAFGFSVETGSPAMPISIREHQVSVKTAPLSVSVLINGEKEAIVSGGAPLNIRASVRNNSNTALKEVELSGRLEGDLFDLSSVSGATYMDQKTRTLRWTAATVSELKDLQPGEEVFVNGTVQLKEEIPDTGRDFRVSIRIQAKSKTLPQDVGGNMSFGEDLAEAKVMGTYQFVQQALWRDAPSKITNSGPFPPKVGTPTQFTIHWKIWAVGAGLKNIKAKGTLLSGAKFTGKIKTVGAPNPSVNDKTGEVVWDIPSILPANGKPAAEAIFQIEVIPSSNQVGSYIPLLSEVEISGEDSFTGEKYSERSGNLDSALPDDTSIKGSRTVR